MTVAVETVESDQTSISEAVVTAIATAESVEPVKLSPRLYDVIDPDALDALFDHAHHDSVTVSFAYGDWTVHIDGGVVTVAGNPESAGASGEPSTLA